MSEPVRHERESEVWCIHNGALPFGGVCFASKDGVHNECLDALLRQPVCPLGHPLLPGLDVANPFPGEWWCEVCGEVPHG